MPDSDNSSEQSGKSLVECVPSSLKKAVWGRAVNAIKQLVGAYAPGVLSKSQANKDERNAMSAITAVVAGEAAEQVRSNQALVNRMTQRWIQGELQKQEGREAVGAAAIEYLEDGESADESDKPIGEDWLNLFGSFAEKATSESVQDLWARMLAGEIKRPGTFSPVTMQFLSLLDSSSAKVVNSVLPYIVNHEWISRSVIEGDLNLRDIMHLEGLGFLSGASGTLSVTMKLQKDGLLLARCGGTAFVIDHEGKELNFDAYCLSVAGKQFCKIIEPQPDNEFLFELFKARNPKAIWKGISVDLDDGWGAREMGLKFERGTQ